MASEKKEKHNSFSLDLFFTSNCSLFISTGFVPTHHVPSGLL